jgi:hypothetical protein
MIATFRTTIQEESKRGNDQGNGMAENQQIEVRSYPIIAGSSGSLCFIGS